ncbi:hypothetical protein BH24ACT6_BH24ACT6_16100 [soil metagenome]
MYVRFFVILAIVAALAALQLVFVAKKPLFARPTPDELAREESS